MDISSSKVGKKPTIVLAQASPMDCQLLADVIERRCRLQVAAFQVNSESLIRVVQENRPDLVLISPRLQDGISAGLHAATTLLASGGTWNIVMLLDRDDRELILESFRCGAKGILTANDSSQDLCKCLTTVLQGDIWASNTQIKYLVEAFVQAHPPVLLNCRERVILTKREEEVLRFLAVGLNDREIGDRMKLNETRVKNYVSGMHRKLRATSRTELALLFASMRIYEHDEEDISEEKFGT